MSKIITLDVGGVIFKTSESTLAKSSFFDSYIERWRKDSDGILFIDRSGVLFEHVLSYLRSIKYPYPYEHVDELEFYGVPHDIKPKQCVYCWCIIDKSRTICELCTTKLIRDFRKCGDCGELYKGTSCCEYVYSWDENAYINIFGKGFIKSKDVNYKEDKVLCPKVLDKKVIGTEFREIKSVTRWFYNTKVMAEEKGILVSYSECQKINFDKPNTLYRHKNINAINIKCKDTEHIFLYDDKGENEIVVESE